MSWLQEQCKVLKREVDNLSMANTRQKNEALKQVALSLKKHAKYILSENQKDVDIAYQNNIKESLIDRLRLNEIRIDNMIKGIETIIGLKDPVWKSNEVWSLENGLVVSKMSVPIGVIGIIYESRPNVTVDAFALALKSGNCIVLRGSSTSIHSNNALVNAIKDGLRNSDISENMVCFINDVNRSIVNEMITLNDYLDLIIPRGGKQLIQYVKNNATVPTVETGVGNCHIFVDETANIDNAVRIIKNAKTQRPGVCNACETVLVHESISDKFLPLLYKAIGNVVQLRGCSLTQKLIPVSKAIDEDWSTEYLDAILAIKVVQDVNEAISHINRYGTKHSEAIITEDIQNSNLFLRKVDAAAVYVNASTRFTDGGQFGFGCEMGISTQKIHARGPIGLQELVTVKYTVVGDGQIRE